MILNFDKTDGLIPVIIQHTQTLQVLMLGYMNKKAFNKTKEESKVSFFSRSKKRLWTKGEESGNFLMVDDIYIDCDNDTLLIKATPVGPTCHTGSTSCFKEETSKGFIYDLEKTINQRIDYNIENSYTNRLFRKGIKQIAQKVGEEAVELVIEAIGNNENLFVNEAADLLYHFLILLKKKNVSFEKIEDILKNRVRE
ncbi:MAG: bifunctional phosphoribosyl-AMP cyclohydrolase/phosphoribosyl-ATP diphosphatase HisIE [Bacteroidetes bacterium]|nr:bifunctional phosphoribosyl-AMP cyclohydrolase/phosphoribosyl-ATP diphosphatase HisIE [Bacteroidota bacterium]